MSRTYKMTITVVCFILILFGPVMRVIDEASVVYYLISALGLIGLLIVEKKSKKRT
ncbi:hypothetical protein LGQ02_05575 [Bacillus shivajii]|uniref:hypothetical protein n=1 Tax=Bacillus shivajii TaxID=1983719 RepID=UPI001CFB6E74|nr:hypothetical protein [Bacillus shivajii]UCZ54232.1 hypothetical protein LGQ02_05575 [Bacillus shivajii]